MNKFNLFREKFPQFIYHNYGIYEDETCIILEYDFEIKNLETFTHVIKIEKKNLNGMNLSKLNNDILFKNMVFNLGIMEIVSYVKLTCSREIIVKCGSINDEQQEFFKKIYYKGLGEFRYINGIKIDQKELFNITSVYKESENKEHLIKTISAHDENYSSLIPVGGGKDSIVTLELLKNNPNTLLFILNPRGATIDSAKVSGYLDEKTIFAYRTIDRKLLELNDRGFLNGHTPFSAMLAFLTYIVAYLSNKHYIALSNESSANFPNIIEEEINHQYSKSIEFEDDFRDYASKYLNANISYFSFLRPLSEIQIAMIFSRLEKYHNIFRSCNKGSKENIWCGNCSKCLFVYSILAPFLPDNEMVEVFGGNLFEKGELLATFLELCGKLNSKPFECVGTYEEMRYAISMKIRDLLKDGKKLPHLLQEYNSKYEIEDLSVDLLGEYNENNNLEKHFEHILKLEIKK